MNRHFHHLDLNTGKFLREISSFSPNQLQFRYAPGSWCALEVLDHVIKTESSIFDEMREHLPRRFTPPRGDPFRCSVVNAVMRSPFRVRVPPHVASLIQPEMRIGLDELVAGWLRLREDMRAWLGEPAPGMARFSAFKHPVGGWMRLSQAFTFLAAHVHHHRYQLKRIRKSAAWPDA